MFEISAKNVHILLVDDSALALTHICSLLSDQGFRVTTATSMAEGLSKAFTASANAVLIDFVLDSGHTGLDLISAVFAASAQAKQRQKPAAAILTHGRLSDGDQRRADELAVAVLQKPRQGQEEEFAEKVRIWLHDSGLL